MGNISIGQQDNKELLKTAGRILFCSLVVAGATVGGVKLVKNIKNTQALKRINIFESVNPEFTQKFNSTHDIGELEKMAFTANRDQLEYIVDRLSRKNLKQSINGFWLQDILKDSKSRLEIIDRFCRKMS